MPKQNVEEFIQHFGVKGMKWGVRKRRAGSSTSSTKSSTPPPKPVEKTLTTAELRDRVNRMQLEKQYRDLSSPTGGKKEKTRGQRFVSKLLDTPGEIAIQVARDQAVKVMSAKLEPIVKKKFGI